jgi:hypothetical protein
MEKGKVKENWFGLMDPDMLVHGIMIQLQGKELFIT